MQHSKRRRTCRNVILFAFAVFVSQKLGESRNPGSRSVISSKGEDSSNMSSVVFGFFVDGPHRAAFCNELVHSWLHKIHHCIIFTTDETLQGTCGNKCAYSVSDAYFFKRALARIRIKPNRKTKTKGLAPENVTFTALEMYSGYFAYAFEYMARRKLSWLVRSDADTWWNRTELGYYLSSISPKSLTAHGNLYQCNVKTCKPWDGVANETIYHGGGAGLLVSFAAVEKLRRNVHACQRPGFAQYGYYSGEDVWLGGCLSENGIELVHVPNMLQEPVKLSESPGPYLSIHRAWAVANSNGWKSPQYYEQYNMKMLHVGGVRNLPPAF